MDAIAAYENRRAALLKEFRDTKGSAVRLGKSTSNLFRHRARSAGHRLNVRSFNHVLSVNPERMTAEVEGMTTYAALVDETLRFGLLPAVVPQLKTITVGGAVSGLGIESSSFRHGLVHETVEAIEVLTGDGRVVECSPGKNRELFFGFPNSYGTLGYALRLTTRLIPAKPYVCLKYTRFSEPKDFFARIAQLCETGAAGFLDGTIFARDEMYVAEAVFADDVTRVSDYTYMDIYYKSLRVKPSDSLTAKDYIWRWDTDWFWCSQHFGVQNPAIRLFAKWGLNSRTYQRLMRFSHRLFPVSGKSESVIQDVQIPIEHAAGFCDFLLNQIGITPVWVCPFRTSDRKYDLCSLEPDRVYINFGFWDVIPTMFEPGHYNRMIEQRVAALAGTKGLYSTSYYDRETFWSLYDKPRYDALKKQYDPNQAFADLYAKCVERR
jgi:FAD/FMN-containing dehydrogenase